MEYQGNIIVLIKIDNFNVFWYLLKCTFFFAFVYAFAILIRLHFLVFLGNFVYLLIFFRIAFSGLFLSFICDGFFAFVYFVFYWLPLFLFSLLCYFRMQCSIYLSLGYAGCRRAPLCCPPGKAFINTVAGFFAVNVVTFLVFNVIFVIVLKLIF
ncbi:MAG: hypothetical protein PHC84_01365 [Clostridia bacterium]|nr:hypothetical protein [Clostridia bacterium]